MTGRQPIFRVLALILQDLTSHFGAAVSYKPSYQKDKDRLPTLGASKGLSGIFMGYVQHAGGGWTGDLWLADAEEVQNASNLSEIHLRRIMAAEVTVEMIANDLSSSPLS